MMSYFDCYLIPVRNDQIDAYREFSERIAKVYRDYGALRVVDCVLDANSVDGTQFHAEDARSTVQGVVLRDFPVAADARAGETVVLSWTEWPSKSARDQLLPQVLSDPRVQPEEGQKVIFEGKRLIAGGFFKLLEV